MDVHAKTPQSMNMQSQLRLFYDLALECNTQCVSSYNSKNLDNSERECVKSCFSKQKAWNDKFYEMTKN